MKDFDSWAGDLAEHVRKKKKREKEIWVQRPVLVRRSAQAKTDDDWIPITRSPDDASDLELPPVILSASDET